MAKWKGGNSGKKKKDVLLSTGGSDELHIALHFLQYLCDQHESRGVDGITYHILLGAMNTDKEAIKSIAEKMDRVVIHENVVDMKSLICSCDLVISAAGSTLYEICACGTPLITYSVADNQVPGAEAFASLGLAVDISDLRDPTSIDHTAVMSGTLAKDAVEKLIRTEHMLAEDVEKRKVMSQKMQTLIDGRGAERLSRELMNTVNRNIRNMMI